MKNKLPKNKSDKGVVPAVICNTCANCKISQHTIIKKQELEQTMSITCLVKHKFKEDEKTQSEFIKIIGGALQTCDYHIYDKRYSI